MDLKKKKKNHHFLISHAYFFFKPRQFLGLWDPWTKKIKSRVLWWRRGVSAAWVSSVLLVDDVSRCGWDEVECHESEVITAMSAEYWHCPERKRRRRPSKRDYLDCVEKQGTHGRKRDTLTMLQRLHLSLHISAQISWCNNKSSRSLPMAWQQSSPPQAGALPRQWRRANGALARYVWSWELITPDS